MVGAPEVLVTRNLRSFKSIPSPIGNLQLRLFALLQALSSTAIRAAFECCLPATSPEPAEKELLELFSHPPQVALIQGNADPTHIISETFNDNTSSGRSTRSESLASGTSSERPGAWTQELAPDDVREVIFLPWSLHSNYVAAEQEGDAVAQAEGLMMVLGCLLYELAHCLHVRTNGYTPQASIRAFQGSTAALEALIDSRKEEDVGIRVLAILLGFELELITFVDGNVALAKLRLPASQPPRLTAPLLSTLLGGPPPKPVDATPFGTTRVGSSPSWRGSSAETFPVAKVEVMGSSCHHGRTKLR